MKNHGSRLFAVIFFLAMIFNASISMPIDTQIQADASRKKESHVINDFSLLEKSVLEKIRNEQIVDFTQNSHPQNEKTEISVTFLKKILFENGLGQSVTHKGICIIGAVFNEELDLENGEITHQLRLEKCQFKKKINMNGVISRHGISLKDSTIDDSLILSGAKIGGNLELDGGNFRYVEAENTIINGVFTMQGARIDGDANLQGMRLQNYLLMSNAEIFRHLDLKGSRIEGRLEMENIQVKGYTDLESTFVNGDLVMNYGSFFKVNLAIADIRGRLLIQNAELHELKTYGMEVKNTFKMKNSICKGILHLQRSKIGSTLDLRKSTFKGGVSITGAKIAGDVYTDKAEFQKILNMEGITIGGKLVMRKGHFMDEVLIEGAKIAGDVYTGKAEFQDILNMKGIAIGGMLAIRKGIFKNEVKIEMAQIGSVEYMGSSIPGTMSLRGTNVEKIIVKVEDFKDFPKKMKLHGFTYNLFIGEYTGAKTTPEEINKEKKFFEKWLENIKDYSPQPYKQCAKALRDAGMPDKADAVLFAGKENQRRDAWNKVNYARWLGLTILKYTIGYGIGLYTFVALFWIVFFVLLGTLVCQRPKAKAVLKKEKFTSTFHFFFYSFDMLLPLISLRRKNDEIELPVWHSRYFYFHKLIGWMLLSFILAGLAGITQV